MMTDLIICSEMHRVSVMHCVAIELFAADNMPLEYVIRGNRFIVS